MNASEIVARFCGIFLIIAWMLLVAGGILIVTGAEHPTSWTHIYIGIACAFMSLPSFFFYALLKAIEPITTASEIYIEENAEEYEE